MMIDWIDTLFPERSLWPLWPLSASSSSSTRDHRQYHSVGDRDNQMKYSSVCVAHSRQTNKIFEMIAFQNLN